MRIENVIQILPHGIDTYCEPYDSARLIWLEHRLPRAKSINDFDNNIVEFYRALQNINRFDRLKHAVETIISNPQNAKAVLCRLSERDQKAIRNIAGVIASYAQFAKWIGSARKSEFDRFERLLSLVQIDSIDPIRFVQYWDTEKTLFFVVPPRSKHRFATLEHALAMTNALLECKGAVIFRADHEAVREKLNNAGWFSVEGLWLNPAAHKKISNTASLFPWHW